ncbi:MAG: hypothetical protein QMD80_04285 [archaeon]|nr:hypothetical protein [archaeon]
MKGKKKWAMIRITEEARERLENYKMQTADSYSRIILKNINPPTWKDKLFEHFKSLEEDFPDKTGILEYMRVIILNSKELPSDLSAEYDKEVELRLNDLSHFGLELKKKEEGETQMFYQRVEHNSHEVKNAVKGSIQKVSKENVDTFLKNHSDAFFTVKEIANSLNIEGKESILKVSKILYRLWKNTDVERRKRGKLWEYRYKKTLNEKYPAENGILSKKTMKRDYSERDNGNHGKKYIGEDSIPKVSTGDLDTSEINNREINKNVRVGERDTLPSYSQKYGACPRTMGHTFEDIEEKDCDDEDCNSDFEAYEHIELLDEPFYGFCYECGIEKQVDFYAQRGAEEVFLCYEHGIQIKEGLEERGGDVG